MDREEYARTELPRSRTTFVMQRILDCYPGTNLTVPTVHSLVVTSQTTFDAKHNLTRMHEERFYNRPIKLLFLFKNENPKGVLSVYSTGKAGKISGSALADLWHVCDSKDSCQKCRSHSYGDGDGCLEIDPSRRLLFAEDANKFTTDVFGAYFYHNLVRSLYVDKSVFPSLLVQFQVFHPQTKKHVCMSLTRNNIESMKDLVTSCMFESVTQKLQSNVNKKDSLSETTSRDLFGLPPLSGTNYFDLVFSKNEQFRQADGRGNVREGTRTVSGSHATVVGIHAHRLGTSAERLRGRLPSADRNGSRSGEKTFRLQARRATFNRQDARPNTKRRRFAGEGDGSDRQHTSSGRPPPMIVVPASKSAKFLREDFKKEVPLSLSHMLPEEISKCVPTSVYDPPHSVKLTHLRKNSVGVKMLRNKFNHAGFKKLILKNEGTSLYQKVMYTEHRESRHTVSKHFELHCSVCHFRNKHLTRRKKWTCKICKTQYFETVSVKRNENKIKNLFNEETLVTNDDGYWIVVPSPIRYMHHPRMMLEAVNRYFRDAKYAGKQKVHALSLSEVEKMKGASQSRTKTPIKFYTYPRDVPMIYGAAADDLRKGKENVFRKKIVSKRCFNACRMVMSVDGSLSGHQISLPDVISKNMGHPKYVLGIRYPSISNLNMTVHEVVVHKNYGCHLTMTARASPAICKGHNLDFDGDAMTFIALNRETEFELRVLISPQESICTNGKMRVHFSRDAMIGLGACADGVTPFHKVLTREMCREFYSGENTSREVYEEFCLYEEIGRQRAINVVYTGNERTVEEYISSECGKMKDAHLYKMFRGQENLWKGLTKEQFVDTCIETRKALLDTPANASDDGYVFSLAMHILKDCILAYDYSLRTAKGSLVTPFGFHHHPSYSFSEIDFPVSPGPVDEDREADFTPVAVRIETEPVQFDTTRLNVHLRNIIDSGEIQLRRVLSGLDPDEKIEGRLHYSSVMRAAGLSPTDTYLLYLPVKPERYVAYLFKFAV